MHKSWYLPRRTFLRGLGASILLPALDVMFPIEALAETTSPSFVAIFQSLGIYGLGYRAGRNDPSRYYHVMPYESGGLGAWAPVQAGSLSSAALPPILSPLESLKNKITVLSGLGTLSSDVLDNSSTHSCATTAWLTSAWASRAEAASINVTSDGKSFTAANNRPPDSLDQYIANYLGYTPGSTLVLNPDFHDYSEASEGGHGGHISYNSKLSSGGSTLVPKVSDPMKAFNTLFSSCVSQQKTRSSKSILDYVMDSTKSVQKKLGVADKSRLDSYLQHVRDLEVKLQSSLTCPDKPTRFPSENSDFSIDRVATLNMMVDIIVLAVSSGAMPIASLMTCTEALYAIDSSRVAFLSNYIGINGTKVTYHDGSLDTHFDIAHKNSNIGNIQAIEEHIAYAQSNITYVKRLIEKLSSLPAQPNGYSPLDNTLILVGACHAHSGMHNTHNLPTLLAGGKSFGLNQGQHLKFPVSTDIGNLYYTINKAMGVSGSSFNGHSSSLDGIFG